MRKLICASLSIGLVMGIMLTIISCNIDPVAQLPIDKHSTVASSISEVLFDDFDDGDYNGWTPTTVIVGALGEDPDVVVSPEGYALKGNGSGYPCRHSAFAQPLILHDVDEIALEMRARSGSGSCNEADVALVSGGDFYRGINYGQHGRPLFNIRVDGQDYWYWNDPAVGGDWRNFKWIRDADGWWSLFVDGNPWDVDFVNENTLHTFDQAFFNVVNNQSEIEWVRFGTGGTAASCDPGWLHNPANDHCYRLTTYQTWQGAEDEANAAGGHLVTINDAAENQWLLEQFGQYGDHTGFTGLWIGFTDERAEGTWQWVSGTGGTWTQTEFPPCSGLCDGTGSSYTNWYYNEPNDTHGGEDYAYIYNNYTDRIPGTWNDLSGVANPAPGIIEKPAGGGPSCGDGICDVSENNTTCPQDCYCGNGTCDTDESSPSCPLDCGPPCPWSAPGAPGGDALRDLPARNVLVGSGISYDKLTDQNYTHIAGEQFDFITPTNVGKWGVIQQHVDDDPNYDPLDELCVFANEHQISVKGHALVWHEQLPAGLAELPWTMQRFHLEEHIHRTVTRYAEEYPDRAAITYWDVVNEAYNDDGTLRETIWSQAYGSDEYIRTAFVMANNANPSAMLIYNDYNISTDNAKSDSVYHLMMELLDTTPALQGHLGVGFQCHFYLRSDGNGGYAINLSNDPSDLSSVVVDDIASNLRRFARLDRHRLRLFISELDVAIDESLDGQDHWCALEAQSAFLKEFVTKVGRIRNVVGVTTWGFTDDDYWRREGWIDPLLWSSEYTEKPALGGYRSGLLSIRGAMLCQALSPVDVTVVDPQGREVSKDISEVPGAVYVEADVNRDGDPDDTVVFPDPVTGIYMITVLPEEGAHPDDLVTLRIEDYGWASTLLDSVRVAELPTAPLELALDRTPPNLSIEVTPPTLESCNGEMVMVIVEVQAQDETDPSPPVALVAIEPSWDADPSDIAGADYGEDDREFGLRAACDPTGARTYTVTYAASDTTGNVSTATAIVIVPRQVMIDIKPGSDPNSINLGSHGVIPVAILTTDVFDATTVDPNTVALAGSGVAIRGSGSRLLASEEDVDDDGDLDLMLHVETENLNLETGSTEAVLTAQTYDAELVSGSDTVNIVGD